MDYRLNHPVKPQRQTPIVEAKRRCTFRSRKISWCTKLGKSCGGQNEYDSCSIYRPKPNISQAKQHQLEHHTSADKEDANTPHALLIGTKTGQCDICKVTKQTLLLRYGFCLCEDCLNVCTTILEQIQFDDDFQSKNPEAVRETPLSTKNKTAKRVHHENIF
jgi:hypothetical protein